MKKTVQVILVHILLWGVYVASEFLANMFHYQPGGEKTLLRNIFIQLPVLLLPTYLIAYYLVPRFLQKAKYFPFVTGILIISILVFYGRTYATTLINYLEEGRYWYMPASKVIKNVIRDYAVIALAVCLKIIDDWQKKDQLNRQLYKAKAEAEIKFLKAQLHPHFLFNTLNNIYGLSLQQSKKVPESILKLSQILDYLIYYGDKNLIALSKELELINNYVELEKLRYGKNLQIQADLPQLGEDIQTTPLILLPFVENAFKHGGKDQNGVFWIKFQLKLVKEKLIFNIENSKKHLLQPTNKTNGIGIKNLKERLELLYPGKYQLSVEDSANFFGVRMEIVLNE